MGDQYIKDGKLYEKGSGIFGGDKELGTVKEGGFGFQDQVIMNDPFTPDMKIERSGLWDEHVDIVGKDTLSELIEGKREGTRIETEEHILYDTTSSYKWTQELGGAKIPNDNDCSVSWGNNQTRSNDNASSPVLGSGKSLSLSGCNVSSNRHSINTRHNKVDHRSVMKSIHRKEHRS